MGMEYKKIFNYSNDYILYQKEYKSLHKCSKCRAQCYKVKKNGFTRNKKPLAKVLWYLPTMPRFKCVFANTRDAMSLMWQED